MVQYRIPNLDSISESWYQENFTFAPFFQKTTNNFKEQAISTFQENEELSQNQYPGVLLFEKGFKFTFHIFHYKSFSRSQFLDLPGNIFFF